MREAPYRVPARSESSQPAALEYVYVGRERDVNAAFHRVWIRTVLFGVGGGACVAGMGSPSAAWLVILGVLAWSVLSWRRTRR